VRRASLLLLVLVSCKKPTQQLLIAGSTTMTHYLKAVVTAYTKTHPDVTVINEEGGASAGVIAVKRGAIDLATVTRDLSPNEDEDQLRNYTVARDAIAMVVHPSNPVSDVSKVNLTKIFEGKITNWKEVGGPDLPITLVVRDNKTSITQKSVRDLLVHGDELPPGKTVKKAAEVIAAVKADPSALGFLTLAKITPELKTLTVDNVPMTKPTVLSARYPLTRSFYLVTYGTKPSPLAEDFIRFVIGREGQAAFEEQGLIAVY
jgi:phosphate transport system substrate-binding protein